MDDPTSLLLPLCCLASWEEGMQEESETQGVCVWVCVKDPQERGPAASRMGLCPVEPLLGSEPGP